MATGSRRPGPESPRQRRDPRRSRPSSPTAHHRARVAIEHLCESQHATQQRVLTPGQRSSAEIQHSAQWNRTDQGSSTPVRKAEAGPSRPSASALLLAPGGGAWIRLLRLRKGAVRGPSAARLLLSHKSDSVLGGFACSLAASSSLEAVVRADVELAAALERQESRRPTWQRLPVCPGDAAPWRRRRTGRVHR
jgi:hypothetical protein